MNDKELLEAAARAAGIKVATAHEHGLYLATAKWWNPLTDDGDALRLAVKLKIHHRQYSGRVCIRGAWCEGPYTEAARKDIEEREPVGTDPYAATRRAIVRAAAEIGRSI